MQSASAEEAKRDLAVIVLAAGVGTRMKSKTPKVLHQICGRPMIAWIYDAVSAVERGRVLIVLGEGAEVVHQLLPQDTEVVIQERQLGTGDAVRACRERLEGFGGDILIMYGDTPLVTGDELEGLLAAHVAAAPACTLMTVSLKDPSHYGRVCRDADGRVTSIIEDRDASDEEKKICEVNAGVYVFDSAMLWPALAEVGSDNVQGEAYLTDVAGILASGGETVLAHEVPDPLAVLGVNSRVDMAMAGEAMRRRLLARHMLEGVTIEDPASTYIDAGVRVGRDTVIRPMSVISGDTSIGEDCEIGPSATVVDSTIDDGVRLVSSHVVEAEVAAGCSVGPFAYLRPGTRLQAGAKAGTFVEIKNSRVGQGAKIPHLSYVGDAEIGAGTNIGAGNITANYDGIRKHRTVIGSGVNTGADTVFVAPVVVGDGSMTGAGSVICEDVPGGGLGIARSRQRNVEGYARRKLEESGGEKEEKPEK
ncbi:MAG: bifunctional UDP-N-acetylglucosamine diphosphorylase/glucosamine-1-phosphate N-acetyltransferase GlmU [Actinomycetota bacterium]